MNEMELHLVMYLENTIRGKDPPSLQEVEEALAMIKELRHDEPTPEQGK